VSGPRRRLPADPITWASLTAEYLRWMRAVGRSPETVRLRSEQLELIAREIGGHPNAVTEDKLVRWLASHPRWKPETRRSYRNCIAGFFEWAYKMGRLIDNRPRTFPRRLPAIPRRARHRTSHGGKRWPQPMRGSR
jgi:integrase/recombinase XerC